MTLIVVPVLSLPLPLIQAPSMFVRLGILKGAS